MAAIYRMTAYLGFLRETAVECVNYDPAISKV